MMSRKPVNRKREGGGQKSVSTDAVVEGAAPLPGGDVSHLDQIDLDLEESDILDDGVAPFVVDHIGFNVLDADPKAKAMQAKAMQAKAMQAKAMQAASKGKAKKKKKEEDAKKMKNKLSNDDPKLRQKKEKVLALAKKDARAEFEQEKAEILSNVPETIKEMFGQIGFGRWGKQHLPCLILSPYQVAPGPARDIWMEMFRKMKENGRPLDKMSFLVYWYGEEKPSDYYSLIPFSGFLPWDKANKKLFDYAKSAEAKLDAGKKLTADDRQRIRGMEQLREDLKKDPEQRVRGDVDFVERDELLSMNDVDELSVDNLSDEDDDDDDDDDESKKSLEAAEKTEEDHQSTLLDSDGAKGSEVELPDGAEVDGEMDRDTSSKKPKKRGSSVAEKGKPKSKKRNRAAMESSSVPPGATREEVEQESFAKSKKKKGISKKKGEEEEPADPLPQIKGSSRSKKSEESTQDVETTTPGVDVDQQSLKRGDGRVRKRRVSENCVPEADAGNEVDTQRIPKPKRKRPPADDAGVDLDEQGDTVVKKEVPEDEMAAPVPKKAKKNRKWEQDDLEVSTQVAGDISGQPDQELVIQKKKGKKMKGRRSLDNGVAQQPEQDTIPEENDLGPSNTDLIPKKKGKKSKQTVKTEYEDRVDGEELSDEVLGVKKKGKNAKKAVVKSEYEDQVDEEQYSEALESKKKGIKTEDVDQVDEEPSDQVVVPKKKRKKPKQPVVETEEDQVDDDPSDQIVIPKKKRKKPKQSVVETEEAVVETEEAVVETEDQVDEDPSDQVLVLKKKRLKSKQAVIHTEEAVVKTEEEGEVNEDPSDEVQGSMKKKQKKSQLPVVKTEDEDQVDEEPSDEVPGSKKKQKKSKVKGVKTDEEHEVDEASIPDGDDLDTAKRIFVKNEEDFQHVLKKWLSAIERKDTEEINDCLAKVLDGLSKLGSRFIEVYHIANYFRSTKIVLKQEHDHAGIDKLVSLKRSMKDHYHMAKKKFPPFEPDVKYPDLTYPAPLKHEDDDGENGRVQSQSSSTMEPRTTGASPDIHNTAIVSELSHEIKQEELSESDKKQVAVVSKSLGWTKDPIAVETKDPQRLMGVEFLRQMALQFPEGKVNPDSVAIAIERSLFDFVGGSVGRMYFERLHHLVAAVCGDSGPGSLMRKIENGGIKSSKELVSLPNDKLLASFRGEEGEGNPS